MKIRTIYLSHWDFSFVICSFFPPRSLKLQFLFHVHVMIRSDMFFRLNYFIYIYIKKKKTTKEKRHTQLASFLNIHEN